MEFLRYIFFLGVLIGSTSIGFLLSKRYIDRVEELNCLLKYANIMQNKIKFTHKPLKEIFEEIAKLETNKQISDLFYILSQKLEHTSAENAWRETISEKRFYLNLKNEDIELLKTLGNVLRKN